VPDIEEAEGYSARRSTGEYVADVLRREIFAGHYGPNQRIAQEDVARRLRVSRIPVREALVILEREGRVRMVLHRGAFVLPMDEESIRDNAELFATVLAFVGRRATERVTPALLQALASVTFRLREAEDPQAIYHLSEEYLDAIIEVGTAPRLARTLRRMRALAVDNLFEVVPGAMEVTRQGVLALIDAIRDGDPDRVVAEQMSMQRKSADLVIAAFQARKMLVDPDPVKMDEPTP
jgi:DNA-binding GntR family transcriptional regulator